MHVFCLRCLLMCGPRSSPSWPPLLYGLTGCNKSVVLLSSQVGHSLPPSVEANNLWSFTTSPPYFLTWC